MCNVISVIGLASVLWLNGSIPEPLDEGVSTKMSVGGAKGLTGDPSPVVIGHSLEQADCSPTNKNVSNHTTPDTLPSVEMMQAEIGDVPQDDLDSRAR